MKLFKYLSTAMVAVALVACGGGGGGGSSTSSSGTGGVTIPTAADFIFELDKTTITNGGSDKAVLTVTALDSNRNVVAGVPVSVSVDMNGVFSASSSAVTTTDSSGKFSGSISIGGDKANRTISATIKVNNVTKVASVVVIGSKISITPVPATPTPGQLVTLNISTTDSGESPIQYAALNLSGTAGASVSVQTDASGNKVSTFNAPTSPGEYTVVATGLGVSTSKIIQVLDPNGSGKPVVPVGTQISSASLTPLPTSILANLAGSTTSRSKLSAKFLTANNVPIENLRVRFEITGAALGGGETISTGTATVYTDASGIAEAAYIAGTRTSPTNGVKVRACYKKTDFIDSTECPASVVANLTVAGTPLSISITDDNKLTKGLGNIAYVKQFLIQVNDSAGVAVEGAVISASVDITHYGKGLNWGSANYKFVGVPKISDVHPLIAPSDPKKSLLVSSYSPSKTENIWCINEDLNRNGFLDLREDVNGDRILQPRKAEIIVSYVNGNKTNADGQMLVQITYGQNMGQWLAYTLRATTGVAGSEGDASKSYITDVMKDDVDNGSFLTPPFGSGACTSSK